MTSIKRGGVKLVPAFSEKMWSSKCAKIKTHNKTRTIRKNDPIKKLGMNPCGREWYAVPVSFKTSAL